MRIVVVSKVRILRDAVIHELHSLGWAGDVESYCFDDFRSAVFMRRMPELLVISAPIDEGLDLVREARKAYPAVHVGVLAMNDDDNEFIAWAGVGICGYIEADSPAAVVAGTIVRLASGETIFPGRLSSLLLHHFGKRRGASDGHDLMQSLTPREAAIVQLLSDGLSNKQIARRLVITDATVKNHVHNILEKLDVRSRGAAAAYVFRAASANGSLRGEPSLALSPLHHRARSEL